MSLENFVKKFIDLHYSSDVGFLDLAAEQYFIYVDELISTGLNSYDYITENNLNNDPWRRPEFAIDALISKSIMARSNDKKYFDLVVMNIIHFPKRSFESSLFSSAPKDMDANLNLLRNSDGDLHPKEFFKKIQSKTNLYVMLGYMAAFDDAEAFSFLRQIPFYNKALTGKELERSLNGVDIKPGSKLHIQLLSNDGDSSQMDPIKYINLLTSLNSKSPEDSTGLYQPKISKQYGHAFLSFTMAKWNIEKSAAQLPLITMMVEDGADWYLAYKQTSVSPSVYLDLLDREKNEKAELSEMIQDWDITPCLKRNKVVLNSILKGIPSSLLESVSEDKKMAGVIKRALATPVQASEHEPGNMQ